jgi:hypothetical protein
MPYVMQRVGRSSIAQAHQTAPNALELTYGPQTSCLPAPRKDHPQAAGAMGVGSQMALEKA